MQTPTKLIELTKSVGLPFIEGREIFFKQAQLSRDLWIKEYGRHTGLQEPGANERAVVRVQLGGRRRQG